MRRSRILTFGNVVMDGIFILPSMPGYDEKTFAKTVSWYPGGPAVHFATASARLGSRSSVLGWVGDDSIGLQVQQLLESRGVELALHRIMNAQTPTAIIMIDQTGEKAVVLSPPLDQGRLPAPEEVAALDLSRTAHLHTHLFQEEYVRYLLAECGRSGISRSLDIEPSSVRRWGREAVQRILRDVDIVFVNEAALRLLAPEGEELAEKLAVLASWGPMVVVCTRGRRGSVVLSGDRYVSCSAHQVVTNSTLAAGDIFASAFTYRYLKDKDFVEATRFASAAAAVAIGRSGSSVYYPSLFEIEETMERNRLNLEINEVNAEWKLI
ncbi:carbohydrate kinase family protein [Paenibacillaceae bacterium WGS1546]|uniref:carbohydrate kinase family protein n=1 Tax=Cohnella sp. WGS1546 TaxID=3366810 RepID=UPI00372D0CEE